MAHKNHIDFIKENSDLIKEPILLVGSKLYDYDPYDLAAELRNLGFTRITGTDLELGPGVDQRLDLMDPDSLFLKENKNSFATILCLEVLTHVPNPFIASQVISALTRNDGILILSDAFARKLSKMPFDFWRFSYDGLKTLFNLFLFYDDRARYSVTRQRDAKLMPFAKKFEEVMKDTRHKDETRLGFLVRRIHRKFLSGGVFHISRMMPEQTVYAVGRLKPAK